MTKKIVDVFRNKKIRVPFFIPDISKSDKLAVMNALNSRMLTDGPQLRKFEREFAKYTGSKYAVGVSNGTAALHLALKALGLKKGDEVIIPNITFVATANSVLLTGATPVLADVNYDDMNISLDSIKQNITSKTKAILPVHIAGKICKMTQIKKIAKKNNLLLIEDCAHAIGTKLNNKHAGTFGSIGCFSFYPTKNFTTIEGGMVITNSKRIAEYVTSARSHGLTRSLADRYSKGKPWDYDIINPGFNYRLDEIRASLGLSQLKRINSLNSKRFLASKYYSKQLEEIPGIITPEIFRNKEHTYHLYIIRIKNEFGQNRDVVFKKLKKAGIHVSLHYKPLHKFSAYKNLTKTYGRLDNSEQIYKESLSLPLYPSISKKQQDLVIHNIEKYEGRRRSRY
jgi:dTDP-4-amino-4,6-dideoxygalactose transaminase